MTTTTLRPNATNSSSRINLVGGAASVHAATSDNSDSTWVAGDGSGIYPGYFYAGLTTLTLPAGAITKQIRGRGRVLHINGTSGAGAFQILDTSNVAYAGTTLEWTTGAGATATIVDRDGGYAPVTLTQSGIDGLQFYAEYRAVNCRFYEAYVDLVYVAKPVTVVSAVTPDPYTASTIVPISWTNTLDGDGGAQSRYQLKVFTAAQYGIGGFSPDTSPNTYNSGEVTSSSLTVNTSGLANSTTYRAYVKVAQTVNGVSHWSNWAFDQFAVSVVTSDVLSVTAAGSNAGAYVEVTVNRNTGTSAWNFVEVERSTDNGATWADVRSATYVDSTANANTFTVKDYETGNGQATLYRARATRILSGLPIGGAWVQSTPSASWSSSLLWLKSTANPALNMTVRMAMMPTSSTDAPRGVFNVLGAKFPVVLSDVRQATTGTFVFRTYNQAEANALRALAESTGLIVHPPPSWNLANMYVSLGELRLERGPKADFQVWTWSVPYVEIGAPGDPLASAP